MKIRRAGLSIALLCVGLTGSFASAEDLQDAKGVYRILVAARDPSLSVEMQRDAAQFALNYLRQYFADSISGAEVSGLLDALVKDPNEIRKMGLNDVKGISLIVTEFTSLLQQIASREYLDRCRSARGIGNEVLGGMADYRPCTEGGWNYSTVPIVVPGMDGLVAKRIDVPNFAYTDNLRVLIDAANAASLSSVEDKASKNPFAPSMNEVKAANPGLSDAASVKEALASNLVGKSYERALIGSIRNEVSLRVRYGSGQERDGWGALVSERVAEECAHCDERMRTSITARVRELLKADEEAGKLVRVPPAEAADHICASLRKLEYPFDGESEYSSVFDESDRRVNGVSDPTGTAQALIKKDVFDRFTEKRRWILRQAVAEGGSNLLILTKTATEMSDPRPGNIKLKCDAKSRSADAERISRASAEAVDSTVEFAKSLNDKVTPGKFGAGEIQASMTYLLKIAPRAVGSALQSFPATSDWVCQVIGAMDDKDRNDATIDRIKVWGSMIVGAALTVTGAGAPVGSALMYAGLTGLGGSTAIDAWATSSEAKALSDAYRNAAVAQGGDPSLLKMSDEEFRRFKQNRVAAMLGAGMTVFGLNALLQSSARRGLSLREINGQLENLALQEAPEPASAILKYVNNPSVNASFRNLTRLEVQSVAESSSVKSATKFSEAGSMTPTYVVELENGMVGVFKPADTKSLIDNISLRQAKWKGFESVEDYTHFIQSLSNSNNEIVASATDDLFGFGLVPSTVAKKVVIDGKTYSGSFQLVIPGGKIGVSEGVSETVAKSEEIKLNLFDALIDNADRNGKNFLVKDDKIIAIDHGNTFVQGENRYNQWTNFGARRPGYSVETREAKLNRLGRVRDMGLEDPKRVDIMNFLMSPEGKALEARLRKNDLSAIREHLRSTVAGLSERELGSYATRIDRRRQMLLDFFDRTRSSYTLPKPEKKPVPLLTAPR